MSSIGNGRVPKRSGESLSWLSSLGGIKGFTHDGGLQVSSRPECKGFGQGDHGHLSGKPLSPPPKEDASGNFPLVAN